MTVAPRLDNAPRPLWRGPLPVIARGGSTAGPGGDRAASAERVVAS